MGIVEGVTMNIGGIEFSIGEPLAGIAAETIRGSEEGKIQVKGFYSTKHGDNFFHLAEQFANIFVYKALQIKYPKSLIRPDRINHYLALMKKNGDCILYVDPPLILQILVKESMEKGSPVSKNQIGDIRKVIFDNISIEEDDGIIYFLSDNWRHGIYFNFRDHRNPIDKVDQDKLETEIAKHYLELAFPQYYRDDEIIDNIVKDSWFPFLSLTGDLFNQLYMNYQNDLNNFNKDGHILKYFTKDILEARIKSWSTKDPFSNHIRFFEEALDSYMNGKYIASISTLYPRIEGILRNEFIDSTSPNIPKLISELKKVVSQKVEDFSLFRYHQFLKYLSESFFKDFDHKSGEVDLARHSSAHGVSEADDHTQSKALIGFLIADQLFYYL